MLFFVVMLHCGRVVLVDSWGCTLVKNLSNAVFVIMLLCGKVVLVDTWGCILLKKLYNAVFVIILLCGSVVLVDTQGCTLVKNLSNAFLLSTTRSLILLCYNKLNWYENILFLLINILKRKYLPLISFF